LLPALELCAIFFFFGTFFGSIVVVISMVAGGLLGVFLACRYGAVCWVEINQQIDRNEVPVNPALNGMLVLFGVLFLTLPGLITDLFGLFLLLPLTRTFVASYLLLRFESYRHRSKGQHSAFTGDTIDIN
jgi:UPF0716 protein FxsA